MEFTLVYEGQLFAHNETRERAFHKHSIRKQFHPQLRRLWKLKLPHWINSTQTSQLRLKYNAGDPIIEQIARKFSVCGYKFVPLVREDLVLACKLDILFLRREVGRGKIIQGGDIDNRLKTLFDALKTPSRCEEIGGAKAESDEDPFFCLLEDDSLITEVRLRADTLLTPIDSGQDEHAVKLIIGVALRPLQVNENNTDFA